MARVICPFCLKPHYIRSSTFECPEHGEIVPPAYVKNYRETPPLWLVTIGFSRHGKTTYLAALTLMLENVDQVWNNVYYRHLDQYTRKTIRMWRREAIEGEMPKASVKEEAPRPILFSMHNIPQAGSRCLVMYDIAGEVYDSLDEVGEYVTSIKEVKTTWFLVSLPDLSKDPQRRTIHELFTSYLSGMESLKADLDGRNVIVIYTKGDAMRFPAEYAALKDYMRRDPLCSLTRRDANPPDEFSLEAYMTEMEEVSDQLREYTRREVSGGNAFISMAEANGINLKFCVTSALGEGADEQSNRLRVDALRYRVLDPFLWSVSLDSPGDSRSLGLILDSSSQSRSVYDEALLPMVWDELSNYGAVATYHMGQTAPASQPGQQPPRAPTHTSRPRLIGPILEKASPGARFMVIGTGPILDLEDFYDTPWRDCILLVMMGEDHQKNWPHTFVYRTADDPSGLVDALLRLL